MFPGARYAFRVFHPASPALRIRYRQGVLVGPHGFPEWLPYARAVVELPPRPAALTVDEGRVADVLAANLAVAGSGDPLLARAGQPRHPGRLDLGAPGDVPGRWRWCRSSCTARSATWAA